MWVLSPGFGTGLRSRASFAGRVTAKGYGLEGSCLGLRTVYGKSLRLGLGLQSRVPV